MKNARRYVESFSWWKCPSWDTVLATDHDDWALKDFLEWSESGFSAAESVLLFATIK